MRHDRGPRRLSATLLLLASPGAHAAVTVKDCPNQLSLLPGAAPPLPPPPSLPLPLLPQPYPPGNAPFLDSIVGVAGACASQRSAWIAWITGSQLRVPTPLEVDRRCCSFLWLWFAVVATLCARRMQRKALTLTWLSSHRGECPNGTDQQPNSLTPAAAQKTRRRSNRSLHWPVQLALLLCMAVKAVHWEHISLIYFKYMSKSLIWPYQALIRLIFHITTDIRYQPDIRPSRRRIRLIPGP